MAGGGRRGRKGAYPTCPQPHGCLSVEGIDADSSRFEVRNPGARRKEADEDADLEAERKVAAKLPDLTPMVAAPPLRPGPFPPEERIWQSLGDGYANLIALSQSTCSHIAKLHGAEIVSLSEQNRRLLGTVEALGADLRQVHVGTAEQEREEVRDAGDAKVREALESDRLRLEAARASLKLARIVHQHSA